MTKLFWNYSDTLFPLLTLCILLRVGVRGKAFQYLLFFLIATVALMGFSNYLADRRINNMYIYHGYALLEVGLLLHLITSFSGQGRRGALITAFLFLLFWCCNLLFFESLDKFNSNSASIAALLIIGYSFYFFLTLIKSDDVMYFQRLPSFWIVSGLLFYYVATILVIGSYKYKEWFTDINTFITWKIQQVANIIRFLLIAIGVLCSYRQTSRDGSL